MFGLASFSEIPFGARNSISESVSVTGIGGTASVGTESVTGFANIEVPHENTFGVGAWNAGTWGIQNTSSGLATASVGSIIASKMTIPIKITISENIIIIAVRVSLKASTTVTQLLINLFELLFK